jgi:hypothetical protein
MWGRRTETLRETICSNVSKLRTAKSVVPIPEMTLRGGVEGWGEGGDLRDDGDELNEAGLFGGALFDVGEEGGVGGEGFDLNLRCQRGRAGGGPLGLAERGLRR